MTFAIFGAACSALRRENKLTRIRAEHEVLERKFSWGLLRRACQLGSAEVAKYCDENWIRTHSGIYAVRCDATVGRALYETGDGKGRLPCLRLEAG